MRKALFLTRHFPPYATGGSSRAWKFASNLASIGWEPVVIAPPAISGIPGVEPSGSYPLHGIYRTGPEIDPGQIDASVRNDLLHGREAPLVARSLRARISRLFRASSDGATWTKSAAELVEQRLAEEPEIELLYAQGPPIEPLKLAIDIARNHSLAVMLDVTAPLDPAMPQPGASTSSVAAKAEEQIVLSGLSLLTPNRMLKEYFLKKYPGRLDHNRVTIVPPAYDASHPVFRRAQLKHSGMVLPLALLVEELSRAELKALIGGLDGWLRADGIMAGGVELLLLGGGASALLRRVAKKPLAKFMTIDEPGGLERELELCRKAGFFCAVMGSATINTSIVPDRLVDALGMGLPLSIIAPEGVASRLVLEAGGQCAKPGDAGAIMELFRAMTSAWSFGSLLSAPDDLKERHSIHAVMQALRGAIATQPVI